MGMIIVLVLISGFLIRHFFWGVFVYFFEKLIQAIRKISIRRFFQTIKLDFSDKYMKCLWTLGLIFFILEIGILGFFAKIVLLFKNKKIIETQEHW